jgi:hypothetical protein
LQGAEDQATSSVINYKNAQIQLRQAQYDAAYQESLYQQTLKRDLPTYDRATQAYDALQGAQNAAASAAASLAENEDKVKQDMQDIYDIVTALNKAGIQIPQTLQAKITTDFQVAGHEVDNAHPVPVFITSGTPAGSPSNIHQVPGEVPSGGYPISPPAGYTGPKANPDLPQGPGEGPQHTRWRKGWGPVGQPEPPYSAQLGAFIVPGRTDQARLVLLHGGEEVRSVTQRANAIKTAASNARAGGNQGAPINVVLKVDQYTLAKVLVPGIMAYQRSHS